MSETFPATAPVPGPAHSPDPASDAGSPNRRDDGGGRVTAHAVDANLAGSVTSGATRTRLGRVGAHPVSSVPTMANSFALCCRNCRAERGDFTALAVQTHSRVASDGNSAGDAAAAWACQTIHDPTFSVRVDRRPTTATATAHLLSPQTSTLFLDGWGLDRHVAPGTLSGTTLAHRTAVPTGKAG
jgi:hypothetical protein